MQEEEIVQTSASSQGFISQKGRWQQRLSQAPLELNCTEDILRILEESSNLLLHLSNLIP